MSSTAVVVVSPRSWLARELAFNAGGVEVISEPGLFWPARPPGPDTSWWMPAEFAARMHHEGDAPTLSAPGPRWLSEVDISLTGRTVSAGRLADLAGERPDVPLWFKPAEAKLGNFPAGWRTPSEVAGLALHPDTLLQWTSTQLDLAVEVRCFVRHGHVLTSGVYLCNGVVFYDMEPALVAAVPLGEASRFAQHVVERVGAAQPAGYVLDVGFDRITDRWVVVEANPAWYSAWYGCAVDAVLTTVAASCRSDGRWEWVPDPELTRRARRAGPLHRRLPVPGT